MYVAPNKAALKLYKDDGITLLRKVGEQDFCDTGCLIVQNIRVPFPDCPTHGDPYTSIPRCGILDS